ncbi:MAG: hypothetical protein K2O18_14205 [Oscillospiraceae bacterium]|nr:hypothetical protein [Oscillospiraceae bacterium]
MTRRGCDGPPGTAENHRQTGGDTIRQSKDEKIIAALLSSPTIRAASAACGISESQIYTRLRNPEFKRKYDKARGELLDRNTAALQSQIGAAIETMGQICNDTETAAQVRLNAADAIIRNSLKLTEQNDILTRLEALEETVNE